MTHYVVVLDWTSEGDNGCNVLGVAHSLADAEAIFSDAVEDEKKMAEEYGWEIYVDCDLEFDAGEGGYYNNNHSRLFIQEVM